MHDDHFFLPGLMLVLAVRKGGFPAAKVRRGGALPTNEYNSCDDAVRDLLPSALY